MNIDSYETVWDQPFYIPWWDTMKYFAETKQGGIRAWGLRYRSDWQDADPEPGILG